MSDQSVSELFMKEDFLHYLWKYKKFAFAKAKTTSNESIHLVSVGQHNNLAGPDFFNASLQIGAQKWAGNVEIHLKSSDWYAHGHENDPSYDNVILHVVWEHDIDIYRKDKTPIPTLNLQEYVSQDALQNYKELFANQSQKWINCENDFATIPSRVVDSWLERLYFERLDRKTTVIEQVLKMSNGDWEAVLFIQLMRSFGTKVNAAAFESLAQQIDYSIVRKNAQEPFRLEALFMGMGELLPQETIDSYPLQLQAEFDYLKQKFSLSKELTLPLQFYGLRPANFPTIRLAQIAQLYHKQPQLFQLVMTAETLEQIYKLFEIQASPYWDTHFNFGKSQKKRSKKLSKSFIDLLIINTILPLRFQYAKHQGRDEHELILKFIQNIKPEKNTIIQKFQTLGNKADHAQDSQSLIELKTQYCDPNHCLSCGIGNYLISN
ncbi:DUF2851 family protein [Dokdonia sp. Hel_I_53]|uniref:DUF2851 family protein n=1 Tax=Dokdonia sp. Hel_I_53 TaxID=1566287 RepID=UPI001199DE3E|nr:DUF2851 family protein [Dokdonia sp. Hel_I_53]TVZ51642.1 uncharacterized protein DUF2851 [Dokdonia sp. Hel_I_53]